jgi:hypothetical protein
MKNKRLITLLSIIVFIISLVGLGIDPLNLNPSLAYESNNIEIEKIKKEIYSYVHKHREDDPLIEVESNIHIKESNVNGVSIDGKTYFYSLFPHMSYDPVSRGEVSKNEVNIIFEGQDEKIPIIIYTIK